MEEDGNSQLSLDLILREYIEGRLFIKEFAHRIHAFIFEIAVTFVVSLCCHSQKVGDPQFQSGSRSPDIGSGAGSTCLQVLQCSKRV